MNLDFKFRVFLVFVFVTGLSACGGGSSNSNDANNTGNSSNNTGNSNNNTGTSNSRNRQTPAVAEPASNNNTGTSNTAPNEIQRLTSSTAPQETVAAQERRAREIISRSDGLEVSNFYIETTDPVLPEFRLDATCNDRMCTYTEPTTQTSFTVDIGEFTALFAASLFDSDADARAILTKNDITLVDTTGKVDDVDYQAYGAWMNHGGFAVLTDFRLTVDDTQLTMRYAGAEGDLSDSRPDANATWRGVMVGTPTRGQYRDNTLQGDAELVFTAADNVIDATFSNIKDLDRKTAHRVERVEFTDVPVANDGTYANVDDGNLIRGGFGGPNHEETAGIFESQGIVGAYGAKKQ